MNEYLKKFSLTYKNKNVWISSYNNCFYLSRFENCSNMNIFFINNKWFFITDDRYFEQAKKKLNKAFILLNNNDEPFKKIISEIRLSEKKEIIIEDNNFSLSKFIFLKKKYTDINFIPDYVDKIRIIKSEKDINNLIKACQITDKIFNNFIKFVKPGISEIDLKKKLQTLIINSEAKTWSFDPIIAGGKNSSNPHWSATKYILKKEDILIIDFGIKYNEMSSDMTRTIAVDQKIDNLTDEIKKVHKIILETLNLVISKIKPGMKIKELENIAREKLKEYGYENFFTHSLGHGLGIDVHELPFFSINSDEIILENMVITIEPGIYLKNKFGIRIEQDILITNKNAKVLNSVTTNLFAKI